MRPVEMFVSAPDAILMPAAAGEWLTRSQLIGAKMVALTVRSAAFFWLMYDLLFFV